MDWKERWIERKGSNFESIYQKQQKSNFESPRAVWSVGGNGASFMRSPENMVSYNKWRKRRAVLWCVFASPFLVKTYPCFYILKESIFSLLPILSTATGLSLSLPVCGFHLPSTERRFEFSWQQQNRSSLSSTERSTLSLIHSVDWNVSIIYPLSLLFMDLLYIYMYV